MDKLNSSSDIMVAWTKKLEIKSLKIFSKQFVRKIVEAKIDLCNKVIN